MSARIKTALSDHGGHPTLDDFFVANKKQHQCQLDRCALCYTSLNDMKEKDKIAHIMECTVEDIETVKGKVLYISDEHKSKKECTLCPPGASFSNITPSGTESVDSYGIDQIFSSIQLLPKALFSSCASKS